MESHLPPTSRRRSFIQQMALCRLTKLICFLLVCLGITFVTIHSYLSSINVDGLQTHKSRSQLAHHEDLDNLKSSDLKGQIEELRRIKASVNNELRDLESKRLSLQTEINNYKTQVEAFRIQQETLEKNIHLSKLSLDQLKLEESELSNRFMPVLKAPEQILFSDEGMQRLSSVNLPSHCRMHTCFDYSKCALVGGFPVFVYKLDQYFSGENLDEFVKSSVSHAFSQSPFITRQPERACVFVAVFGETFSPSLPGSLQEKLNSLDHWNGDGRNHMLIDVTRSPSHVDLFNGVKTGRAIVVQSSFMDTVYRPGYDIVIPPSLGGADGAVWTELPPLSPIRRQFLLSFLGQFKDPGNVLTTVSQKQESLNVNSVNNILKNGENGKNARTNDINSFKVRSLLNVDGTTKDKTTVTESLLSVEYIIVKNLKRIQTESKEKIFLKFNCDKSDSVGVTGEWGLCGSSSERSEVLRESMFSVIISPANYSIVSTVVFQTRVYEALKNGAIPVILGEYTVLPYDELIDWRKGVIFLPKARVSELHFLLRTFSDSDMMDYKWHGRLFWERYFGTTSSIISTMLSVLRTRLQIPAHAVTEEPSVSSVSNFIPVAEHLGANPEDETDEMLGPIEAPFASPKYTQNFTSATLRDVFNKPGDPFHLFPHDPFTKILPSDAKFKGSGYGFRPVNKGEGGSGKEFSESLGGNHPREQFTMVMLTYERSDVLILAVTRLKGLPYLNKVIVVWNNPTVPSENLGWPDIGVPVVVVKMKKNSLNNRFLPFEAIETEAVLSIDDDSHLRHDEIVFGFRVWREERDRIVGFPGRYHAWDVKHNSWLYNSNYSCEMSMVLTGAAFFHKYYAYLYSYSMPQAIREKVDEYMNCEDIAMNFLVSHITRKPPVKVTSRWTFRCPNCPQTLALDMSHFDERHKCINFFMEVYGYMPLLYTQYRVDSILFKTRISHDKQKCFKYI